MSIYRGKHKRTEHYLDDYSQDQPTSRQQRSSGKSLVKLASATQLLPQMLAFVAGR
jgi:hypothetical protein